MEIPRLIRQLLKLINQHHFYSSVRVILSRDEWRRFVSLIAFDILISVLDIAFLAFLVFVIHVHMRPEVNNTFEFLPSWLSNSPLLLITVFFLLYGVKNLFGFLIHREQSRFVTQVATRLSRDKLNEFLSGNYQKYVNVDSAGSLRKISHQPIDFAQHILGGIQQVITQSVLIGLTISLMIAFNARVFLFLFLLLLPAVIGVFYFIRRKSRVARENSQVSIEKSWQHLHEALNGFVESNIYHKNDFFVSRYVRHQQDFNNYVSDLLIIQGIPTRMIELFVLLGLFLLIAINQGNGTDNSDAIVTIGAFMAAAYKIIPGIVKILNTAGQIINYAYTLSDLQPARSLVSKRDEQCEDGVFAEISLKNVSFRHNGGPLLQGISMKIQPGDFVGISGCSGRGKTTVLNLLLGFLPPHSGSIEVNGKPLPRNGTYRHWKYIAYVKQEPFVIHDTVAQNIILDNAYSPQRLQEVIDITGLSGLLTSGGKKKIITEHGKNLSGGQRQRIAIARALYKDADVIILDEPFNELDKPTEQSLLAHFKHLASEGKVIILITHNTSSFCYCNKMLSLDDRIN